MEKNGVIEKLKEFKGKKIILMNKEKKSWQESDKIIEFVFGEHVRFESKKNRKARILCVF